MFCTRASRNIMFPNKLRLQISLKYSILSFGCLLKVTCYKFYIFSIANFDIQLLLFSKYQYFTDYQIQAVKERYSNINISPILTGRIA